MEETSLQKRHAAEFVFPPPSFVDLGRGGVILPKRMALRGMRPPDWLCERLGRACRAAGIRLVREAKVCITLAPDEGDFGDIADARLRKQSYRLVMERDGMITLSSPGEEGLRYGLITLALFLEAAAAGARLTPLTIRDVPCFAVRGFQIDMAREFFPPLPFLRRMIERAADLKFNTVWLYLENHFHAPGLEDLSPRGGLTPDQARELSAYAAERGIDLVPGTNVLSHMEGWFRLERYCDFADGASLSYPVLTRPEPWALVRKYLDGLAEAFPSKNFHAGLDELLFTGTNPEAAAAIRKKGKARYFADFACKVIAHLQKVHRKTVWIWDDMVLGKNIFRPEGFNETYREALDRIPRDVVMTHWWYWTEDGVHTPMIERVAASGRPFVVAPSTQTFSQEFGSLRAAAANQAYMARCGRERGAFGLINTHWESRYGSAFLAGWPLQAMAAGFGWSSAEADAGFLRALSFTLTGDDGAMAEYLKTMDRIQDLLQERGIGRSAMRSTLFLHGPHALWRRHTNSLPPNVRLRFRRLLDTARAQHAAIGPRDPALKDALRTGITLFEEALEILDAFDLAWAEYHRAAEAERLPGRRKEFERRVEATVKRIGEAEQAVLQCRAEMTQLQRRTGHTPYDAYALGEWAKALRNVARSVHAVARDGGGLPYFEKLLHLPRCYHVSNLRQLQVQNTFHTWHGDGRTTPPPIRWADKQRPAKAAPSAAGRHA